MINSSLLISTGFNNTSSLKDVFTIILLAIVFIPSSFNQNINFISLYLIIPLLFVLEVIKNRGIIKRFYFFRVFLLLFLCMILSGFAASDSELFWKEIKIMVGVVIFSFVAIGLCHSSLRYIYVFYFLYFLKFLYIFFYALSNGLLTSDITSERFELDELNSNVFGYFGFFALISTFLLSTFSVVRKTFFLFSFYLCFLLIIYTGVAAASRGTLIVSMIMFLLLIAIRYLFPLRLKSAPYLIIFGSIIFGVYPYFSSLLTGSLMMTRMESIEDSRIDLFFEALSIGYSNLAYGVGAGNFVSISKYGQFSHNSFAELFANCGLLASVLYLVIMLEFVHKVASFLNTGGNKQTGWLFISIILCYFIYNFFYVFYINFFLMTFFFILRIHFERISMSVRIAPPQQILNITL